jgi:hypothetical protein
MTLHRPESEVGVRELHDRLRPRGDWIGSGQTSIAKRSRNGLA